MFFATSRLGSRKNPVQNAHLDLHDITDELSHPSRILFTEEVILGICMVITGLLFLFAQMPNTVFTTAQKGRSLMTKSMASLSPSAAYDTDTSGMPLMAAAQPMLNAIHKAQDLEARRDYGPATEAAWQDVADELTQLGLQPIQMRGQPLPLWMLEAEQSRIATLESKLTELLAPTREAIRGLRRESLTKEQVAALAIPSVQRTVEQQAAATSAETALDVSWETAAYVLAEPAQTEALGLCRLLRSAQANADAIASYRDVVNFEYWRAVAKAAATPAGQRAREAAARAGRALEADELEAAQSAYEECLTAWQAVFMDHPEFANNMEMAKQVADEIDAYQNVLNQLGLPFDDAFSLPNVMRLKS
jgi:hypothetical protein